VRAGPRSVPRRILTGGALAALAILGRGAAASDEARLLGAVEDVRLIPWNVTVRARIDTGAGLTSLDARRIEVSGPPAARTVRFTLAADHGQLIETEMPLVRFQSVRDSGDRAERRPVVRVEVCLARVRTSVEVTLSNRTGLDYRMLVGRNLLERRFLVDVARTLLTHPECQPSG